MPGKKGSFYWILNIIGIACALILLWQFVEWRRAPNGAANSVKATPAMPMVMRPDPSAVKVISAEQLRQALNQSGIVLIDSREWDSFEEAHITGAIIMPLNEIESRARHELPPGQTVYVHCHFDLSKMGVKQPPGAKPDMTLCNLTSVALGWMGFHKALYIPDDPATLAAQGIPITGTLRN